jgi:L-asparaginase
MSVIIVLSTGGTIASRRDPDGAARPALIGEDLLATLPAPPFAGSVDARPDVIVRNVLAADSSALTLEQLDAVRAAVVDALSDPAVSGVVVTHGTDTMEETALLVDLSHTDPRPVVFTGAQQPADSPTPDGPANLALALTAAADPGLREHGVLLAFAGVVQTVRGMSKASTVAPQPFSGGALAPASLLPRRTLVRAAPIAGLRVDVVASYPGADATLLDAAVAAGAAGVVLEATGSGNTTAALAAGVRAALAAGVVVVLASRIPFGEVDAVYGGGSGAYDLVDDGAVISRRLRAGQARIALLALLAAGVERDWIAGYFSD